MWTRHDVSVYSGNVLRMWNVRIGLLKDNWEVVSWDISQFSWSLLFLITLSSVYIKIKSLRDARNGRVFALHNRPLNFNTFNQFSCDLVQILCHRRISEIPNYQLSKMSTNNLEKARKCKVIARTRSCINA